MDKKMYVGIDMGTNSVGMAVTDEEYNLYRVKGKDFWCSRLFKKPIQPLNAGQTVYRDTAARGKLQGREFCGNCLLMK